uniref:Uncharacterized protein LOC117348606 isoform X1 n=1 Tax=Geotrypetes seraphini TaxID=260995 RepID=A0A6P8P021_GEOSA|nr:uncharacterized protein LOC117348606 isoform X1 [Geotrypetes seraphini]
MVGRYGHLGSSKKWTPWRKSHLQETLIVLCVFTVLGIVSLGHVEGWTPARRLVLDDNARFQWGWRNATSRRQQEKFSCEKGQRCTIANITTNVDIWKGPHNDRRGYIFYALYQSQVVVNVTAHVSILCCLKTVFPELNTKQKWQAVQNCSTWNGTVLHLTLEDPKYFVCTNASLIKNRTTWADYIIFVNIDSAKIDPGQVKRLPSTCEMVGQHAEQTRVQFKITFPPSSRCRYRRAWYDTILGGFGTITGTINSYDIESLANRLHNAGSKINDALIIQANWMPTIWYPMTLAAGVDNDMLDLFNASNSLTFLVDTNITHIINWTICSLQTLQQQQQKNVFQTQLLTANEQVWRAVFSDVIRAGHWLQIPSSKIRCEETLCQGYFTIYNVTKQSIMCKYIVMPLLIGSAPNQHFWTPTFYGQVIDMYNRTHDLTFCDNTLSGKVCKLQCAVYEPCLLQNTVNKCEWTIMPITYRYMVEIAPQVVCVVTDQPVIPGMAVPFAGCIHNISVLHWENDTFILTSDVDKNVAIIWNSTKWDVPNWDLNLTRFKQILTQSTKIQSAIRYLNQSIMAHQLTTTIAADSIVAIGSGIADATSHHWWDIFLGYSPSARTTLDWIIHPLLIVVILVIILSIWNCYVAYGICCKQQKVMMVTYNTHC